MKTLQAFRIQLLDSNDSRGRISVSGVEPAFVDLPKSALSDNRIAAEVSGGGPQLREGEDPQIGVGQHLPSRTHALARRREPAAPARRRRRVAACLRYSPCSKGEASIKLPRS